MKNLPNASSPKLELPDFQIETFDGNLFKKFLQRFGKLNEDFDKTSKKPEAELSEEEKNQKLSLEKQLIKEFEIYEVLDGINNLIVSVYQESFRTIGNISANLFGVVDYSESEKSVVKILKINCKVVGFFLGKYIPSKMETKVVELAAFLSPEFQNKGLGTKMLKQIIDQFPEARYFVATTPNPNFVKSIDNLLTRITPEINSDNRIFISNLNSLEVLPKEPEISLGDLSDQKLELINKLHEVLPNDELLKNGTVPEFFQDFYPKEPSKIPGLNQNDSIMCIWRKG